MVHLDTVKSGISTFAQYVVKVEERSCNGQFVVFGYSVYDLQLVQANTPACVVLGNVMETEESLHPTVT